MRLFVAIAPPASALDEVEARLAGLRPAWPQLRWTSRAAWHITLAFLGEVGEHAAAGIHDWKPLEPAAMHDLCRLLHRGLAADRDSRSRHQVSRGQRGGLRPVLAAQQQPGLVRPARVALLQQQVGLRHHADHAVGIIEHGNRADVAAAHGDDDVLVPGVTAHRHHVAGHHLCHGSGHRATPRLAPGYLTTSTGRSLRWITLCAVLPTTRPARSPWPLEPITITPAS